MFFILACDSLGIPCPPDGHIHPPKTLHVSIQGFPTLLPLITGEPQSWCEMEIGWNSFCNSKVFGSTLIYLISYILRYILSISCTLLLRKSPIKLHWGNSGIMQCIPCYLQQKTVLMKQPNNTTWVLPARRLRANPPPPLWYWTKTNGQRGIFCRHGKHVSLGTLESIYSYV